MKYVTAIFYTKSGSDKVIYEENFGNDAIEASEESRQSLERIIRIASLENVKNIHVRTFELGIPSLDLR